MHEGREKHLHFALGILHFRNSLFRALLDLRPVHDSTQCWIETITAMHGAPVVPEHKIARPPVMAPGQSVVGGYGPDVVQQRLGFLLRDALEV